MTKRTVLLIEDDPAILRALKDNFEFDGYRVMTAGGGNAGLQAALKCQPDLVIVDVRDSGKDRHETCRQIRLNGLAMPTIMLTEEPFRSAISDGLEAGANVCMTMPFSIKDLLARSAALLRQHCRQQ